MPQSTDILKVITEDLAAIEDVGPDQVKLGKEKPPAGETGNWIAVIPMRETSSWLDGTKQQCVLEVAIACIICLDESLGKKQFEQMNETWNKVQLVLEDLVINAVNKNALMMEQDDGVEWDSFDDGDRYSYVGTFYKITYERTHGSGA